MKYGFRSFDGKTYSYHGDKSTIKADSCSCNVRNCNAIPRDMQSHVRELHNLITPPQSRLNGMAKKLLSGLADEADKTGVQLLLLVSPENRKSLIKLYSQFDFIVAQDNSLACVMIRAPREEVAA